MFFGFVELIHSILVDGSNATQAMLRSDNDVDDGGAMSALTASLFDYITGSDADVHATVMQFFDRLFAAVYLHRAVPPATVECVASLRRQGEGVEIPFAGVDSSVADDLARSARVARVFLDSLRLAGVVARSLGDVDLGHQCSRALTRLRYCATCEGVLETAPPRPCRPFCANVARGCLVHLVAGQTSRRWEHFVDAVNQLALFGISGRRNLEGVLSALPKLISDEVTRLQANIQNYRSQVR